MEEITLEEHIDANGLKIVVVGVGKAGLAVVDTLIQNKAVNGSIETLAVGTENDFVDGSKANTKVAIQYEETDYLDGKRELEIVKVARELKK